MRTIYIKNNQEVYVHPKFVYHSSVYRIWKLGASIIDDKYYISCTPLNLKKIKKNLKKKGYTIQRYIDLEGAPEEYLITQGFKKK